MFPLIQAAFSDPLCFFLCNYHFISYAEVVLSCLCCCLLLATCAWTDLTTRGSAARSPANRLEETLAWRHSKRPQEGPGLLVMTAGAQRNDKTGELTACEMHTCLLRWQEPESRR